MATSLHLVLLLAGTLLSGTAAMRTKFSIGQASGFEGYLWRTGNDLRFKWADKPITGDDITLLAKVAPANVVKGWEFKQAPKNIKNSVNYPKEMHIGFENFFRLCRQKGITVTLLSPVVKWFFFNEGERISMIAPGQSVNIQDYEYAGIIDGDSDEADDLNRIESVQWLVFKDAIDKAKGRIAKLDAYDNLPKLSEFHKEYSSSAQDADVVDSSKDVSEDVPAVVKESKADVVISSDSPTTPGCYLFIEKVTGAEGGFSLNSMYSKDDSFASDSKVLVGFFEPSQSKVAHNSWKYNTGNRRTLMRGTMAGGGKLPKDYLQHFASFMNEGRKMEGKFTLLPNAKVKVIFHNKVGAGESIAAVANEPVDLTDKDMVAVLDESEEELDKPGWTTVGFIDKARKLGYLFSWSKD